MIAGRVGRRVAALSQAAALLALVAAVGACGPSTSTTESPVATATLGLPSSPVEGVIVHVESAGLDKVSGFTLRTADTRLLAFTIGPLENGDVFPPGHLAEHQATAEPVRVYFTVDGPTLVATRLEDAGG